MKLLRPTRSHLLVAALALGCAVSLFAPSLSAQSGHAVIEDAEALGNTAGMGAIPDALDPKQVRDIVALSFAQRGWTVKAKQDTRVVGYLAHRGREATMTAVLDFESNEIHYFIDGWAVSKSGERKKRDDCEGWVTFIKRDVNKRLNVAAATL
ncbi:hypothetical protein ASA1KI_43280 [Opitutales bacterium ASA1]|uniref:hypothetical protein n=1 Tax=Congregicoccus parvus TaxID=3081749 RepID=UPI002B2C5121|nr:hypothetical protein ASA1KI_43280 [Opitutales bacterium ASA1]